jgi:tRNA synthetases class II (A)
MTHAQWQGVACSPREFLASSGIPAELRAALAKAQQLALMRKLILRAAAARLVAKQLPGYYIFNIVISMRLALQDVRSQAGAAQHGQRLQLPGEKAFLLYDSYGFPLEITAEIAAEQGVGVDAAGFEAAMAQQRQRSKDAVKVCQQLSGEDSAMLR